MILNDKKILLLDDVTSDLDLKGIKKNKKNIILFTTNSGENLMFADNLIIIKEGKIYEQGELEELLQNENLFIKNDIELPFMSDLSNKIMSYQLIDRPIYEMDEMVDEIWQ